MSDAIDRTNATRPEDVRPPAARRASATTSRGQLGDARRGEADLASTTTSPTAARWRPSRARTGRSPAQLRDQLDDVERALGQLDDGTYGACEVCGAADRRGPPRGHAGHPVLHRPRRLSAAARPMAQLVHLAKRFFEPSLPARARAGRRGRGRVEQLLPGRAGAVAPHEPARPPPRRRGGPPGRRRRWATAPPARCWPPPCCTTSARSRPASAPTAGWSPRCRRMAVGHDPDVIARLDPHHRLHPPGRPLPAARPSSAATCSAMAGSDPLTEAWAREHHLPESDWTVDLDIGRALKDADDD